MLDLLYQRRSIRRFTDEEIDEKQLERILNAGLLAPSSKSKYPCEFVVCNESELLMELSKSKPGGANFLKFAKAAILVTGNEEQSDVWVEDCSIAAAFMLLQAEKEGLGSCWIQIRERQHNEQIMAEEFIQKLLGIPENQRVLSILALGHKDAEKEGRNASFLKKEKIHFNKF